MGSLMIFDMSISMGSMPYQCHINTHQRSHWLISSLEAAPVGVSLNEVQGHLEAALGKLLDDFGMDFGKDGNG